MPPVFDSPVHLIPLMYFAFTTLSTVGFGDMYPVNDAERVLCVVIFLFGVSMFSYVLGNFQDIMAAIREITKDVGQDYELESFIEVLKHYNQGKPIDDKL
jgi:voltage-gated potassium channel